MQGSVYRFQLYFEPEQKDSNPEEITITAILSGKEFWQHAQLFRQSLDDKTDMFNFTINF